MKSVKRLVGMTIVLAVWVGTANVCLADSPDPHPDDIYWADGFFLPGGALPGQYVYPIIEFDSRIVIGGGFEIAGSVVTDNIASWDGVTWESFGAGIGDYVFSLAVYDGQLIAGGSFGTADSMPISYVAGWNGITWEPLGDGPHGYVNVLCIYNSQLFAAGNAYAIGESTEYHFIVAWDGADWLPLDQGTNSYVLDLVVFNGLLVTCGQFTQAGGTPAGHVAVWDGATWSPLGQGMNGNVWHLAVNGDSLLAAGDFSQADDQPANNISVWDGSSWSEFSGGYSGAIRSLAVHEGSVAIGVHNVSGAPDASSVLISNGSTWSQLGSRLRGTATSLASIDGQLFAAGRFVSPDTNFEWNVATWEDSVWRHPVGNGANNVVWGLIEYNDLLIAGGKFSAVGGIDVDLVAAWDGSTWSPLDTGTTCGAYISELVVYQDHLVAGGFFYELGGVSANSIAAWDGNIWSPLGSGIPASVKALAVYDGKLIVGGHFDEAGGLPIRRIAAWDGSSWSQLGAGMNGSVYALAIFDNKLIAGGKFDSAGGIPAGKIAVWDGTVWTSLGSGIAPDPTDAGVFALTVYNEMLIAGGFFQQIGGVAAQNVAAWDGASWSPLGGGVSTYSTVSALTVYEGQLFAVGSFDSAGGAVVNSVAMWDGVEWLPLGSGIHGSVEFYGSDWGDYATSLAAYKGALMVGGDFMFAGNKLSAGIAQWTKHYPYGLTANDLDSLYAFWAFALQPIVGTIYLAYYSDSHSVNDIVQSSVMINNQIMPLTTELLTEHPTLEGEVLAIEIDMRELVQSYGPLWGRAYHSYTISGQFSDGSVLAIDGAILIVGHIQGDVNADGTLNVADITFLVEYLFTSGPAPQPLGRGDIDCDGAVNIADLTYLVDYLFFEGPPPPPCP